LVQDKSSRLDAVRTAAAVSLQISFHFNCSFCLMEVVRYRRRMLERLDL
jgi:hypothetical protein